MNKTILRFDGESLSDHSIDVNLLAPSLLALSEMIQNANNVVNGNKAKLNIKVNANIKQNCFEIMLLADMNLIQQVKDMFNDEKVVATKELLEWLGILGGGGVGALYLIKKLIGKPIEKSQIKQTTEKGIVSIDVGDENTLENVNINIVNIYNDKKVRKNAQNAFKPLLYEGIDSIEFGEKENSSKITKDEYKKFSIYNINEETVEELENSVAIKYLKVHSATFSENAEKWSFLMGDQKINANIIKTDIARDAIKNRGIKIDDVYKAKLESQEYKTESGLYRTKYTVLEVLEFIQAKSKKI